MNTSLNSISINDVKHIQGGSYIDDDLILMENMSNMPITLEPRRMDFILLALCTQGEGEYSVDTIHHKVRAGDIIIVSNGAILDYYKLSPDHKEVVIIISSQYFHEVLAGVHDLSTMYIFSRMHPLETQATTSAARPCRACSRRSSTTPATPSGNRSSSCRRVGHAPRTSS